MPSSLIWKKYSQAFAKKGKKEGHSKEYIHTCLNYAEQLYKRSAPIIFDPVHFSLLVGYSPKYIMAVTNSPDNFYRQFSISKKNGGSRNITEPLPSLKEIQHWILTNILNNIPVSKYAKAYISKESIKSNARFHRKQPTVLCLDIKDFFGSIHGGIIFNLFRTIGYRSSIASLLTNLCIYDDALPQGAPTSPALSNIIMKGFDQRAAGFCKKREIRYTRYADDLTFSGTFFPKEIIRFITSALSDLKMDLNPTKTRILGQGQQQRVTGIVVNEKMQVPRKTRRNLRQSIFYIKKYGISSHQNHEKIYKSNYVRHLLGIANHILFINPKDADALNALSVLKPLLNKK
ncbi:retron St85 family RNA-directed DNA polymerase [Maridesulfovibrio ferrireducens]|uniref:retron St85 family RNA-directed DNA polymerase n=1 Tax=Maridesulfovibrio ferrireducens TaxID=246191 RepID=UPI001A2931E7|nr:retron St85 family RNA-directed DNA polymerase [Maridesulfovibrio ferrireducens]MBI9110127.1 retron St85 family RNA-directed DNA polymerase [Maridesulfovibrio ferrireducens]